MSDSFIGQLTPSMIHYKMKWFTQRILILRQQQ